MKFCVIFVIKKFKVWGDVWVWGCVGCLFGLPAIYEDNWIKVVRTPPARKLTWNTLDDYRDNGRDSMDPHRTAAPHRHYPDNTVSQTTGTTRTPGHTGYKGRDRTHNHHRWLWLDNTFVGIAGGTYGNHGQATHVSLRYYSHTHGTKKKGKTTTGHPLLHLILRNWTLILFLLKRRKKKSYNIYIHPTTDTLRLSFFLWLAYLITQLHITHLY